MKEQKQEYIKENQIKHKTLHEEIKSAKTVNDKIQRVGEFAMGPKHKHAERCAIFELVTNELIADKMRYFQPH